MKTFTKILLLVVFIIGAIVGVMVFEKTQVEPPVATKYINQYTKDLQETKARFPANGTMAQKDSAFTYMLDRLLTFRDEHRVAPNEADKIMDEMLEAYVPHFVSYSYDRFSQSEWRVADHRFMLRVIADLRKAMHSDYSLALTKGQAEDLSKIEGIIARYRQAWDTAHHTTYRGVASARATINQAKQFANDEWLKNCEELKDALNDVKPSLESSHYNYVLSRIRKGLEDYRHQTEDFFNNTLVPRVDRLIKEYGDNAVALYGSKRNYLSLKETRDKYCEAARMHYAELFKQNTP